jgi:hypothetical protein
MFDTRGENASEYIDSAAATRLGMASGYGHRIPAGPTLTLPCWRPTGCKYAAIERGQSAIIGAASAQTLATMLGVDIDAVLIAQAVARATFVSRASR